MGPYFKNNKEMLFLKIFTNKEFKNLFYALKYSDTQISNFERAKILFKPTQIYLCLNNLNFSNLKNQIVFESSHRNSDKLLKNVIYFDLKIMKFLWEPTFKVYALIGYKK